MKIIGLCSPFNGVGKTTLAKALQAATPHSTRRSFAEPFSGVASRIMSYTEFWRVTKRETFNWHGVDVKRRNITIAIARAVNEMLPGFPEHVMRGEIEDLIECGNEALFIDDVRRKPEAALIHEYGGVVMQVCRPATPEMEECEIYELGDLNIDYSVDATDTAEAVRNILRVMGE